MSVRRLSNGSPLTVMVPSEGGLTPASAFMSVDFPEPLSPMMATSSPGWRLSAVGWRMHFSLTTTATASASSRSAPRSSRATKPVPSKMRRYGPIPISDPVCRWARRTSWPSTRVPLRDTRSRSSIAVSPRTTSAWKRETFGSSSTTSLEASRPSVRCVPSNWIRCVVASARRPAPSNVVSCPARKRSASPPTTTVSPFASRRAPPRKRSPLSCVPLREPRSTTQKPPCIGRISA